MPKIRVKDIEMYYEIRGELKGEPLVLIGGLGFNLEMWDNNLLVELGKKYKLILFDNRGSGRTDKPNKIYSIRLLANDLLELLDKLKIKEVNLFGHSLGGLIAQQFVLDYSERVKKVILASTWAGSQKFYKPKESISETMKNGYVNPEEVVNLGFTNKFKLDNPTKVTNLLNKLEEFPSTPISYQRQYKSIDTFNQYNKLKKIKNRTLIIHGKEDAVIPPQNAKILANKLPKVKLFMIDEAGHYLTHNPSLIRAIDDFLD